MGGWRGSENWPERTTNDGEGVKKWSVEVIRGDGRVGSEHGRERGGGVGGVGWSECRQQNGPVMR